MLSLKGGLHFPYICHSVLGNFKHGGFEKRSLCSKRYINGVIFCKENAIIQFYITVPAELTYQQIKATVF